MPWWRYLGPWPLRLPVMLVTVFVITVLIFSGIVVSMPGETLGQAALFTFVPAAVAALVATGVTWAGRTLLGAVLARSLPAYLIFLLVVAIAAVAARYVVTQVPIFPFPDTPDRLVGAVLRYWGWIIGNLAVTGAVVQRLRRETEVAQDALAESRRQQAILLESEERSRRQVAQLLHDRVQAGIIAASLELRLVGSSADDPRVQAVIERLERLRDIDLRQAARALSPDLTNVDLRSALTDLASGYEPTMVTRVDIAPALLRDRSVSETVLLAIYRIVEQGLLNAAGHGRAGSVRVSVSAAGSALEVLVADDGRGLPAGAMRPGLGTAVIEAWCQVAGGTWRLEPGRGEGAVLRASLPVA
jgi:signal transduction histidine kinase